MEIMQRLPILPQQSCVEKDPPPPPPPDVQQSILAPWPRQAPVSLAKDCREHKCSGNDPGTGTELLDRAQYVIRGENKANKEYESHISSSLSRTLHSRGRVPVRRSLLRSLHAMWRQKVQTRGGMVNTRAIDTVMYMSR